MVKLSQRRSFGIASVAMDRIRALKARLAGARVLLESHVGKPTHEALSRLQADAVLELVADATLSAEVRSDLASAMTEIQWRQVDLTRLLAALTASAKALPPGKRRRSQQNYTSVLNFVTDGEWEDLTSGSVNAAAKLSIIINIAIGLGLRCPSEHSAKLLCSWWLFVSEPESELPRLAPAQKLCMLNHVKAQFNAVRAGSPDPALWLDKLPETPVQLLRDFEAIYRGRFPSDDKLPVPAPIDVKGLLAFDLTYGCRGGGVSSARAATAVVGAPPPALVHVQESPMERMASAFMAAQQRMMEQLMAGNGCSSAPTSRAPRSLENLVMLPPARRLPALTFGASASSDGSQQRADDTQGSEASASAVPAPPPPLALQSCRSFESQPDRPPTVTTLAVPQAAIATLSAAGDVGNMLDMLQSRRNDKRVGAQSCEEVVADEHGDEVPQGEPSAVRPAAPNPRRASEAKVRRAKAAGKPKAKVAVKPKAKAAVETGKAKAVETPSKGGCSKCRYSAKGCGQCRKPGFSGVRMTVA